MCARQQSVNKLEIDASDLHALWTILQPMWFDAA
jgi:hypothetical protein